MVGDVERLARRTKQSTSTSRIKPSSKLDPEGTFWGSSCLSLTPIALARVRLAWDDNLGPIPGRDLLGQPEPDVESDQRIA